MEKTTINVFGLDEDAKDKLKRDNPDALIIDVNPVSPAEPEKKTRKARE